MSIPTPSRSFAGPIGDFERHRSVSGIENINDQFHGDEEAGDFQKGPWLTLLQEVNFASTETRKTPFESCIRSVLKEGFRRQIPRLAVVIKSISPSDWGEMLITVHDPSGTMEATVHRRVREEFPNTFVSGAALLLHKLSVYSPSTKVHYLNITVKNVHTVYGPHVPIPRAQPHLPSSTEASLMIESGCVALSQPSSFVAHAALVMPSTGLLPARPFTLSQPIDVSQRKQPKAAPARTPKFSVLKQAALSFSGARAQSAVSPNVPATVSLANPSAEHFFKPSPKSSATVTNMAANPGNFSAKAFSRPPPETLLSAQAGSFAGVADPIDEFADVFDSFIETSASEIRPSAHLSNHLVKIAAPQNPTLTLTTNSCFPFLGKRPFEKISSIADSLTSRMQREAADADFEI